MTGGIGEMVIQLSPIKTWSRGTLAVILVLLSGLATERALAASEESSGATSLFDSKYTLALGGFFPRVDTSFTLDPPGGGGTTIDGEDDLGLDKDSASAWVNFNWRFFPRHQLQLEWFNLKRDGSTSASESFTIFDTVVGVGASLDSTFDFNLGRLTYGYSIMRSDKFDLSFLIGAHIATIDASVTASGNVTVDGTPILSGTVSKSSNSKTFPLPHIGGSMDYKFTPKLTGKLNLLAFYLDVGSFSGSLIEADAYLGYQLTKHFGLGGGLKYFNVNVEADVSDGRAQFDLQFFGPAVFGYVSF